jgi:hypothetical protein
MRSKASHIGRTLRVDSVRSGSLEPVVGAPAGAVDLREGAGMAREVNRLACVVIVPEARRGQDSASRSGQAQAHREDSS